MNQPTLPLPLPGESPLDRLGRCRTPIELIAAMAEVAALRDPARIPELRKQALQLARANPPRAEHLEKVVKGPRS